MVAAEAYLELFLCRLTEPALIGLFLRFIVASTDESESVLSSLITRLAVNSTVSLPHTYSCTYVCYELFDVLDMSINLFTF